LLSDCISQGRSRQEQKEVFSFILIEDPSITQRCVGSGREQWARWEFMRGKKERGLPGT